MKLIIFTLLILFTKTLSAQTYQYYFIESRATAKGEVAINPENNMLYSDVDSLLCERSDIRGREVVKERKYPSYSDMFNRLSREGMEFIQFVYVSKIGGAAQLIAGSGQTVYMVWRKKL